MEQSNMMISNRICDINNIEIYRHCDKEKISNDQVIYKNGRAK